MSELFGVTRYRYGPTEMADRFKCVLALNAEDRPKPSCQKRTANFLAKRNSKILLQVVKWSRMGADEVMRWVFANLFYPATVIGFFIAIAVSVYVLIDRTARMRGFVAALIPFVSLVFIVRFQESGDPDFADWLAAMPSLGLFVYGAIIGLVAAEGLRYFKGLEGPASFLVLFLASVVTFVLYAFIQGTFNALHFFFFGFVLLALVDVLVRGNPLDSRRRQATIAPVVT